VVDTEARKLLCACVPCAFVFAGSREGRWRAVRDRVKADPNGAANDEALRALGVPVGLVFFFRPSSSGHFVAIFPSPAGPTEAELPEAAWQSFASSCPLASEVEDDVEALLVNRRRDGTGTTLLVPIDACYELTALLRRTWRGIDGGDEARLRIEDFIARLVGRAASEDR
jgi:hypothetical protein